MRFCIDPTYGGAIIKGEFKSRDRWVSFMPDTLLSGARSTLSHNNDYPSMLTRVGLTESCFVMAPYSNRIKGGRLRVGDASYALERSQENSIHGDLWYRSAEIIEQDTSFVSLKFNLHTPKPNWPHDFVAVLEYRITGDFFYMSLEITNTSDDSFVFEGGFHPYFLKNLMPGEGFETTLRVNALDSLKMVETGIPLDGSYEKNQLVDSLKSSLNFAKKYVAIDNYFRLDKNVDLLDSPGDLMASIEYYDHKSRVDFWGLDNISGIVVYNPPNNTFALEPVSHANGDFSGKFLDPGETKKIRAALEYLPTK